MNNLKSIFAKLVVEMSEIKFIDHTEQVKGAIDDRINAVLEECAGELRSQVQRNTKVGKINGGNTKSKWKHIVDDSKHEAYVGNNEQTAIWMEFGTGEHALEGKGRRGGWYVMIGNGKNQISQATVDAYGFKVVYGKDGKKFAHVYGMKPQRPLYKAYTRMKNMIIKRIQDSLKGL